MRARLLTTLGLTLLLTWLPLNATVGLTFADETPDEAQPIPSLTWQSDYSQAKQLARDARRQLLIVFHDAARTPQFQAFRTALQADRTVATKLASEFVLAWLATDTEAAIDGETRPLLEHAAFRDMHGRPGLVIIDYRDDAQPHYGYVTSVLPVKKAADKSENAAENDGENWLLPRFELLVLLDLPVGSLTQRTLIFAVRTHPDRPASTSGELLPVLAEESTNHATHQANIRLQGHHDWNTRFHRINAKLPAGLVAVEVCAESWNGQGLLDAARECVHSWRQSSGHWNHVREAHRAYGYDMKRGSNGTWYATGIFGRNR